MFPISNILYPITSTRRTSLPWSRPEIARFFKCTIHILYVNDPGASRWYPADHEDAVALKVKEVVPGEVLEKSSIRYAVAKGELAGEIMSYCKNNNIDLIVTGHKLRSKLYSMLLRPITSSTRSRAVLVIPKK